MPRSIDWFCECGERVRYAMADPDDTRQCVCGKWMQQDWLPRLRHDAQWDDSTSVMILVNDDPSCPSDVRVRYPGRHDCRVPSGYRKVFLRSLAEVNRFEREHHVMNHRLHYDSNGCALDDGMETNYR